MLDGAVFIIPLLYSTVVLAIVVVVVLALWRIMKAQEATAHALERIAHALMQRPRPPV